MDALLFGGLRGIVGTGGTLRVPRHASGGQLSVVIRPIPVADPLPDVAGHVVQTVALSGELRRLDATVAVLALVLDGEAALIRVRADGS